jgi:hypothetical protein
VPNDGQTMMEVQGTQFEPIPIPTPLMKTVPVKPWPVPTKDEALFMETLIKVIPISNNEQLNEAQRHLNMGKLIF